MSLVHLLLLLLLDATAAAGATAIGSFDCSDNSGSSSDVTPRMVHESVLASTVLRRSRRLRELRQKRPEPGEIHSVELLDDDDDDADDDDGLTTMMMRCPELSIIADRGFEAEAERQRRDAGAEAGLSTLDMTRFWMQSTELHRYSHKLAKGLKS